MQFGPEPTQLCGASRRTRWPCAFHRFDEVGQLVCLRDQQVEEHRGLSLVSVVVHRRLVSPRGFGQFSTGATFDE